MSDEDELPSWAGKAVQPGGVALSNVELAARSETPRQGRRTTGLLLGFLGLVLAAALGTGAWWFATRDDSSVATDGGPSTSVAPNGGTLGAEELTADATATTAAPASPTTASAPSGATPDTGGAADGDRDGAGDGSADNDGDESGSTTDVVTDDSMVTSENPDGSIRYAVLSQGQVFLRGRVPSADVGEEIAGRAGLVVGPGNVFNEYEIDPTVPVDVAGPVFVEEMVLFAFNSIAIEPAFLPILDLGTLLMSQNPAVEITIVARTDAVGNAETNLEVSRQRAQAVIDYWESKGIDPSRLTVEARGEDGASDDDDPQMAALNRRAEFVIRGLLG